MSNEQMTAARALADLRHVQELYGIDLTATIDYIAARLQPVAGDGET